MRWLSKLFRRQKQELVPTVSLPPVPDPDVVERGIASAHLERLLVEMNVHDRLLSLRDRQEGR